MKPSKSASTSPKTVKGWLLDLYPSNPGEMTLWVISEDGERLKLVDGFQPKIYVSGREEDLRKLTDRLIGSKSVESWRFTEKYTNLMDREKSRVLEIDITDCRRTPFFARKILRLGGYERFRLHNVDVPDAQAYLYDHDIFPLAFLEIRAEDKKLTYRLLDSVESEDYRIPPLRMMWIRVEIAKTGKVPSYNDPIHRILLESDCGEIVIDKGDEKEKLLNLVKAVREADPDIVFTHHGDSHLFPNLARRALVNGVLPQLVLGREEIPLKAKRKRGITFFSYGQGVFQGSPAKALREDSHRRGKYLHLFRLRA